VSGRKCQEKATKQQKANKGQKKIKDKKKEHWPLEFSTFPILPIKYSFKDMFYLSTLASRDIGPFNNSGEETIEELPLFKVKK